MRALALSLLLVHSVQAQGDLESAALVVGIDNYTGVALDPESNRGRKELSQGALPDPPKLTNAAADARRFANFLLVRYGIKAQLLPQDKATARGILAALNALVSRVRPGGRAIFYFAGHGTRIANGSRGGELDEALVPADASRGAYPIRDVELGLIYRKAIGKKIQLTVILDSCFSGGMARGEDEAVRAFQDLEPRSVDDPTARFDVSSPLFGHLAAARAGRRALDGRGSGRSFTEVLLDALSRTPHELTLAEAAAITSQLVGRQGPEAEGGARGVVNIVGKPAVSPGQFTILAPAGANRVDLNGGRLAGLTAGSVLQSPGGSQYEVAPSPGETRAVAKLIAGAGDAPGTRLSLLKWLPEEHSFAVHTPRDLPDDSDFASLAKCRQDTTPPAEGAASISWSAGTWWFQNGPRARVPFDCNRPDHRAAPVAIPLTKKMASELRGRLRAYAGLLRDEPKAPFTIVGRLQEGKLQYALQRTAAAGDDGPFPTRSEWNNDWAVSSGSARRLGPAADCRDPEPCALYLSRRIQRFRVAFQLAQLQIPPLPGLAGLRLQARRQDANGKCTGEATARIETRKTYCIYLANPAQRFIPPRRLALFSIDGAGLRSPIPVATQEIHGTAPEHLLWTNFAVQEATEGDRETLFLITSGGEPIDTTALLWMHDQGPPAASRDGQPVQGPAHRRHAWFVLALTLFLAR